MSSAFLYVGIVAIWAFVLIPRWLRRPQAIPEPAAEYEANYSEDANYDDQHGYEQDSSGQDRSGQDSFSQDGSDHDSYERLAADPASADERSAPEATDTAGAAAAASGSSLHRSLTAGPVPPLSRSRMLQARRRLLTVLVLLCAATGACTALKLTSWWACIPPAGMLGIYLLLLREVALADAEQARRRAALDEQVQAGRQRAQALWDARAEEYSAEIIDISARVGDQLYDQYADATIRAVGD